MTNNDDEMKASLYKGRKRLKREMERALSCISPVGKRLLVAEWKETYSEVVYEELLRCARNGGAAEVIANWNIEELK
jgi:hypothetical protein